MVWPHYEIVFYTNYVDLRLPPRVLKVLMPDDGG